MLAACNQMYWGSEKRSLKNQVEKPSNSLANKKYETLQDWNRHTSCVSKPKDCIQPQAKTKETPPSWINNVTDMTTIINNSLSFHLHVSKSPKEKSYIFTKAKNMTPKWWTSTFKVFGKPVPRFLMLSGKNVCLSSPP